jgi:hypothetical protein
LTEAEQLRRGDDAPARAGGGSRSPGLLGFLREGTSPASPRAVRWAAITFGVLVAVAVPVIFSQGSDQWFFLDEWTIVAGRELAFDDLVRPHNEHLILVPVFVYRALYRLVGIDAYWPYQAVLVTAHVASATMLRVAMRRAGVGPWIATAAAGTLLVFGSGRQDIVWAFQISFTGALALGLAQLLLADHDGPAPARDALGVACGIAAVATSSVGVVMVGVVALSSALRGRWRTLAIQTVPPAVVWTAWWWSRGRGSYAEAAGPGGAVEYAAQGLRHAFAGLGRSDVTAAVLGVAVVAGLVLAVRGRPWRAAAVEAALPVALFAGGLGFVMVTGFARAGRTGNDVPQATRYVYLVAALALPLIAYALQQLAVRGRWLVLVPGALLLAGVPGNVDALRAQGFEELTLGREEVVLVGAHLPELGQLPGAQPPFGWFEGPVTADWLRDALADGKVPSAPDVSPEREATIAFEVLADVRPGPPPGALCPPLTGPVEARLQRGESLTFLGGSVTVQLLRSGAASEPQVLPATGRQVIHAVAGPLDLVVTPGPGEQVDACIPGGREESQFGVLDAAYQGIGPRVAVLGDSIAMASADEVRAELEQWSLRLSAIVGEGLAGGPLSVVGDAPSGLERAADLAGGAPAVAVVALGTNDAMLADLTADEALAAWDQITNAFGGACIVGVTVTEDGEGIDPADAAAINARVRDRSDVVVPWAERSGADPGRYVGADGIHPTPEGEQLFATMVAEGVEACPG